MRVLLTGLLLVLPIGSPAWPAEPPVLVIRVPSTDDLVRQIDAPGSPGSGERMRIRLFEQLGIDDGEWLDRDRPLYAAAAPAALFGARGAWTVVLPVADPAATLTAFGGSNEILKDGVRVIRRKGTSPLLARVEDDYVTVGEDRKVVAALDRAQLEALGFPEGGVAVDLDLEALAPSIDGLLALRRRLAGPPGMALELYEVVRDNASHIQLSLEGRKDHGVLHLRMRPSAGSDLEALLEQQPRRFPELARAVPTENAHVLVAGNVSMTPALRDGLRGLAARGESFLETLTQTPGRMSWILELLGNRPDLLDRRLECVRGDFAGSWGLVGEAGLRQAHVLGISSGEACADLARDGLDGHVGRAGDVMLTTGGTDAGERFEELARRLRRKSRRGGIRRERFAPLKPAGGIYAELSLQGDRVVVGIHGEDGLLSVDIAVSDGAYRRLLAMLVPGIS